MTYIYSSAMEHLTSAIVAAAGAWAAGPNDSWSCDALLGTGALGDRLHCHPFRFAGPHPFPGRAARTPRCPASADHFPAIAEFLVLFLAQGFQPIVSCRLHDPTQLLSLNQPWNAYEIRPSGVEFGNLL